MEHSQYIASVRDPARLRPSNTALEPSAPQPLTHGAAFPSLAKNAYSGGSGADIAVSAMSAGYLRRWSSTPGSERCICRFKENWYIEMS